MSEATALRELARLAGLADVSVRFITYNYDDLLERELRKLSADFISVYDEETLHCSSERSVVPIYHVHGYLPNGEETTNRHDLVLSEREYNVLISTSADKDWRNRVQMDALTHSTCIFVGFSLDDPNTRRIIDLVQKKKNAFIFRQRAPEAWTETLVEFFYKSKEHYHRALAEHHLSVHDVLSADDNSFGLKQVLVGEWDEVPRELERLYRALSV